MKGGAFTGTVTLILAVANFLLRTWAQLHRPLHVGRGHHHYLSNLRKPDKYLERRWINIFVTLAIPSKKTTYLQFLDVVIGAYLWAPDGSSREYSALLLGSGLIKLKFDGGVNVLADEWNNFLKGYHLRDEYKSKEGVCDFTLRKIIYASLHLLSRRGRMIFIFYASGRGMPL